VRHVRRGPLLSSAGLAALLAVASATRAQEEVLVRRYSDVVAIRVAPGEREKVLYYFDPTADLRQGGHVEQGSGGHSLISLSGGGRIEMRSSGHAILDRLASEGDVVRFPILTMVEIRGGARPLQLALPGGVSCSLGEGTLLIEELPKRLRLRNQGGYAVSVIGPTATEAAQLAPGEEVVYPLLEIPPPLKQSTLEWGDVLVRYSPGVEVLADGQTLRVERSAEGELHAEAPVSVGGVATRPGPGLLVVRNLRPPVPRPPEPPPAAEPPPAVEPAPAEPAAEPEPQPAPDEPVPEPGPDAPKDKETQR
jgi:hypothetical protein